MSAHNTLLTHKKWTQRTQPRHQGALRGGHAHHPVCCQQAVVSKLFKNRSTLQCTAATCCRLCGHLVCQHLVMDVAAAVAAAKPPTPHAAVGDDTAPCWHTPRHFLRPAHIHAQARPHLDSQQAAHEPQRVAMHSSQHRMQVVTCVLVHSHDRLGKTAAQTDAHITCPHLV